MKQIGSLEEFKKKYLLDTKKKENLLGKGGYSSVYKVQEVKTNVEYAFKIIKCNNNEEFVDQLNEIIILTKLSGC